jgi:hypothetical protein
MDYDANVYLAVTLSPSSPHLNDPTTLASVHPAIALVGQMGTMRDVQLYSVPKQDWAGVGNDVLRSLKNCEGVGRVDVQELKTRVKRGGDEF